MLNILVNAYAVSPIWGSEPGMGWNWVSNLARYCNLFIITEGEWQKEIECSIEAALNGDLSKDKNPTGLTREQAEHMHFYYSNVTPVVRTMCWNQGDWRFYKFYREWQINTLEIAQRILKEEKIDIVHQLNMIGFREPGMLWKIQDKPFVWGPIGGMELMPTSYLKGESLKVQFKERLKNFLNTLQRNYQGRVIKALNRADGLAAATKGCYEHIKNYHHKDVVLINETGCFVNQDSTQSAIDTSNRFHRKEFDLMWVGKFDFRKQLGIGLKTMALLKDVPEIKLHVIGSGYEADVKRYYELADRLGLKNTVAFHGSLKNTEVHEMMRRSDAFFFTSIMDATSTVVLEAIGAGLPVICYDTCGFGPIVDDSIGRKIKVSNPEQAASDFARIIRELYADRDTLAEMSKHCIERQQSVSWDSNAKKMVALYEKAIESFKHK